jgi:hypothetical protein
LRITPTFSQFGKILWRIDPRQVLIALLIQVFTLVNVVQLDFDGLIFKTFVLVHRVFVIIVAIASRHLLDS